MRRQWFAVSAILATSCSVLVDPDATRLDRFNTVDTGLVDRPTADDQPVPVDQPVLVDTGRDGPVTDVPTDTADATTPTDVTDGGNPTDVIPDVPSPDVPVSRCTTSCDDGVECTVDSCDEAAGVCRHRADDTICGARERCDATMDCVRVDCTNDADCQDETLCNGRERCDTDRCVPGTAVECADTVECTVDRCEPSTGACTHTADTARCDDGAFCNGAETCDPTSGCRAGTAPDCNDDVGCTGDRCDESTRRCVNTPNPSSCVAPGPCVTATCDATMGCRNTPIAGYCDSYCASGATCIADTGQCSGGSVPRDCSDGTACTTDVCDPTARTCRSTPVDADGDGFAAANVSGTACAAGNDCNDADPAINRGATEVCNRVDDDCDGMIDEGDVCVVPGEDCAHAIALNLTGATTTLSRTGTTAASVSDFTSACGGNGPDLVYAVTLPANADLVAEVVPTGTDSDPTVSVRDTCAGAEVGCNDNATQAGRDARLWLRSRSTSATSRVVYVVVDESRATGGAFTLRVSRTTPIDPSNCGSRTLFNVTVGGTVIGRTTTGLGSHQGSCGGNFLGEDVLFFNATASTAVNLTLATGNQITYVRQRQCAGLQSQQLACFTGTQRVTVAAGSAWIFVDAARDAGETTYILRVQP